MIKRTTSALIFAGALLLEACATVSTPAGQAAPQAERFGHALYWGLNPQTQKAWSKADFQNIARASTSDPLQPELKNTLAAAIKDLERDVRPHVVSSIEKEGRLHSDPRYTLADQALEETETILKWAICAEAAPDPAVHERCFTPARKALLDWAKLYEPTGNPINDNHLIRMLVVADLLRDDLNAEEKSTVETWLRKFITSADTFYANIEKKTRDGRNRNNWNTWRLALRSLAGATLGDRRVIEETKARVRAHAEANLAAPANWKRDLSCDNGETAYGGIDFQHRDALHYHVYNLEAWLWIATFTPEILADPDKADRPSRVRTLIAAAFDFLKPYYEKEKTHIEFKCSLVKFDVERKDAGEPDFQNKAWEPTNARKILRMARGPFPSVRPWTTNVVDQHHSAWLKLLYAAQVPATFSAERPKR